MNQIRFVHKGFELHQDWIYCLGANMAPNCISKTSPSFGRIAYRNLQRWDQTNPVVLILLYITLPGLQHKDTLVHEKVLQVKVHPSLHYLLFVRDRVMDSRQPSP